MGKLYWNQWARLIALTAAVFEVVGGIFSIFYRYSMFEALININFLFDPFNYFSIFCIISGVIIFVLEYPVSFLKNTFMTTSFIPRILLYIPFAAISILNYQNVNPALYLFIATLMYTTAAIKGETNRVNSSLRSSV